MREMKRRMGRFEMKWREFASFKDEVGSKQLCVEQQFSVPWPGCKRTMCMSPLHRFVQSLAREITDSVDIHCRIVVSKAVLPVAMLGTSSLSSPALR